MKTDDLIAALSADTTPTARPERGAGWLVAAAMLAGAVLYATLGLRPDPGAAFAPLTLPKTVLPLVLGGLALALAWRSARPAAAPGALPGLMLGVAGLVAALVGLRIAISPPATWGAEMVGSSLLPCLVTIPLVASLPLACLLGLLRRGATLRPRLTGLAAGLATGGIAAALYSLHCTEDSPLFWAPWYGTGILLTGALGAVLGGRLLRW